jgi:hypothetical protein
MPTRAIHDGLKRGACIANRKTVVIFLSMAIG